MKNRSLSEIKEKKEKKDNFKLYKWRTITLAMQLLSVMVVPLFSLIRWSSGPYGTGLRKNGVGINI